MAQWTELQQYQPEIAGLLNQYVSQLHELQITIRQLRVSLLVRRSTPARRITSRSRVGPRLSTKPSNSGLRQRRGLQPALSTLTARPARNIPIHVKTPRKLLQLCSVFFCTPHPAILLSFPMNQRIYLDYNATTPVDPQVLDAMLPFFSENFGNASSIHLVGQKARSAVESAREQVAALIGAQPQEIIFTSGGTESDNHAIFGMFDPTSYENQNLVSTVIEHEAVLNTCQSLKSRGVTVAYLAADSQGRINPDHLREILKTLPDTTLISVMHANNELGTVQPLEEIGRLATDADVYFHTDAVQSAGKLPIDVNALQVDLLSMSGHKIYAPKGIGALYIRTGTPVRQFLFGGHHQRGFRPGTENVAGIVGLGKAAELARASLNQDSLRVSGLRDDLERGLLQRVPYSRVNASTAQRSPNTTNMQFPGVDGEALLIAIDLKGLACSTGSACSSGAVEPSHVLTAIGLSAGEARSSLRFSLGRHTTREEIDAALLLIPQTVEHLREISPNYGDKRSAAG
jgi:cysteine desulfurase